MDLHSSHMMPVTCNLTQYVCLKSWCRRCSAQALALAGETVRQASTVPSVMHVHVLRVLGCLILRAAYIMASSYWTPSCSIFSPWMRHWPRNRPWSHQECWHCGKVTIFVVEMAQKRRLQQGFYQIHARASYPWSPVSSPRPRSFQLSVVNIVSKSPSSGRCALCGARFWGFQKQAFLASWLWALIVYIYIYIYYFFF